jgi:hypothetical protein
MMNYTFAEVCLNDMDATRDTITREAGLRSPITRRLTQIMPAHIAADGIDLVGSSVLPTHFEPMGV